MMLWIARDKDEDLFLYNERPQKFYGEFRSHGTRLKIDSKLFPEVTWENSPIKVELKIKK